MPPRLDPTRPRRHFAQGPLPLTGLLVAACLWVAPGCEEETRNVGKRPETRALDQTGVSLGFDEAARPVASAPATRPPAPAKPPQTGPIIGQRTTDIRDAKTELTQGGARVASQRIVARDPITLQGNAYVTMIGQTAINNIKHAVDLYQAENGRYPKDLDEFMTVIIKANNIALPQLPPYQKYGYDENEHKLIVLEYPDLKNAPGPR